MNIIEIIQNRRSVRTYTGEPISSALIAKIEKYISQLQTPFGNKARIELIHTHSSKNAVKVGTYGLIKGACDFLTLIYEDAPFAESAAASIFEQAILYCTDLGLGTCWLAGFSRSDVIKQIEPLQNEKIRIISPVGYISDKKSFVEKHIIRGDKNHANRKPFGTLFYEKSFNNPLTEENAGIYAKPLEMVRLAPSANNKQEWRVLLENNVLHFYKKPYPLFDSIDIGIALCHFDLTCKQLGINGKYEILNDFPAGGPLIYVISWILETII